ncbi:hypothetical protein CAPTEDRAFT_221002 [Capitella teleta]|uniref:BPTI/Kunitz inhibitor domain-containing protein n=1 Tax=Capitella teleta TaxID=283909 RepID=R7VFH6_CAPTE|nr:hypothetical protein CAPTEDRAFT_221002 [Capitella teleta]|eukprot:ELU17369.1 hypothetical protein CAPTEDRAFT_221002 [Capitella teleta]
MCRPSEHLMILNGKGCPICECTSLTPCRNKECTKPNEICQMFTSCEDDLDSCEPEARCTDICRLPLDHGTCGAFYLRWYYDSSDGVCKKFNFGGCNGNRNNFLTKQDCLSNCTSSNPTTKPPPTYSWTATTTTTQVPVVEDKKIEKEDIGDPVPVGCPLIPCPACPIPYEPLVFTDAASCQVCHCSLAITQCKDMPCEDHQKCVMTSPPLCQNEPCDEIPTCVNKPILRPQPEGRENIREENNITEEEVKENPGNGIQSEKQIKEADCAEFSCSKQCEHDQEFVYDTAGCKTCACANSTCETHPCSAGQICRMVQVQCVTMPCNPVAQCLDNELCDTNCKITCDAGSDMAIDERGCSLCFCEGNSGAPVAFALHSLFSLVILAFMAL